MAEIDLETIRKAVINRASKESQNALQNNQIQYAQLYSTIGDIFQKRKDNTLTQDMLDAIKQWNIPGFQQFLDLSSSMADNLPEGVVPIPDSPAAHPSSPDVVQSQTTTTIPPETERPSPIVAGQTLRSGVVLKGQKASYRLSKYLGGGAFGEVWAADVTESELKDEKSNPVKQVALKTLNPGLNEIEQQRFWLEPEVLGAFHPHPDGYSRVPLHFESQKADPYPFFVQTLATGTPVDELMRTVELSERDALDILAQFYRVLQSLHEGLQKSYLDFQPKNIFWNAETHRILVIDWNVLASEGSGNFKPEEDLKRAAQLLYRLLMGIPAPQATSPRALAQPKENWQQLSVGVQNFLVKALGQASEAAYPTASSAAEVLEKLLAAWDKNQADLKQDIDLSLPEDAASYLDIWKKRFRQESLSDKEKELALWLSPSSALEKAIRVYVDSTGDAISSEFRSLSDSWDERIALKAARWTVAIEKMYQTQQETRMSPSKRALKEGLEHIEQGHYAEASNYFQSDALRQQNLPESLSFLVQEVQIWDLWEKVKTAERDVQPTETEPTSSVSLKSAITYCDDIQKLLEELPYKSHIEPVLGNLTAKQKELQSRIDALSERNASLAQIWASFETGFQSGYEALKNAFDEQPGDLTLTAWTMGQIRSRLDGQRYDDARALAALALDYNSGHTELRSLWRVAAGLVRAQQLWEKDEIEDFRQHFADLRLFTADAEKSYLRKLIVQCLTPAVKHNPRRAGELYAVFAADDLVCNENEWLEFVKELKTSLLDKLKGSHEEGLSALRIYVSHWQPDSQAVACVGGKSADYLLDGEYEKTIALLDVVKSKDDSLAEYRTAAQDFLKAQQSWNQARWEELFTAWKALSSLRPEWVVECGQTFVERCLKEAETSRDYVRISKLAVAPTTWRTKDVDERIKSLLIHFVDDLGNQQGEWQKLYDQLENILPNTQAEKLLARFSEYLMMKRRWQDGYEFCQLVSKKCDLVKPRESFENAKDLFATLLDIRKMFESKSDFVLDTFITKAQKGKELSTRIRGMGLFKLEERA